MWIFGLLTDDDALGAVTALQGLQSCIQASKSNIAYLNGWGGGVSTGASSAGRKLLQTSENCAQAAAISSSIREPPPCHLSCAFFPSHSIVDLNALSHEYTAEAVSHIILDL